jgi:hypothetical protein
MLAWCNQKIGSSAALSGSLIQPSPPIMLWMSLWGVLSSAPGSSQNCSTDSRSPPNPGRTVPTAGTRTGEGRLLKCLCRRRDTIWHPCSVVEPGCALFDIQRILEIPNLEASGSETAWEACRGWCSSRHFLGARATSPPEATGPSTDVCQPASSGRQLKLCKRSGA